MPTDKKQIKTYIEDDKKLKIEYIAKIHNRTASNYLYCLIEQEIKRYESEHGIISISDDKSK